MYDCSETLIQESQPLSHRTPHHPSPARPGAKPLREAKPVRHPHAVNELTLSKRFPGQSWVRFRAVDSAGRAALAQVQALAPQLHAQACLLDDGSLLLRGLSLENVLSLSNRFATLLSVSAHIAGTAGHD